MLSDGFAAYARYAGETAQKHRRPSNARHWDFQPLFIGLVLLVVNYCAYMPASQAFWDWRVRRMCAAEGGLTW
ncbi:hypothetical protein PRZ03_23650 [Paucibacter sp. hw8]|uniref:Transposase n=1 Tax=Roseateles albus TaxID=2987525 RepID=A0ABT5KNU9_9BURK|nr:hypothetical protein [Roseateles albus]